MQKNRNLTMQPKIETLTEKKLVGMRQTMSLANNQTVKLWQTFMPRRKEITNNLTTELISLQRYPTAFDFTFANLNIDFEKWATVEVTDFGSVPEEMETLILTGGLYAVFHYKGLSSNTEIFQFIYGTWLPNSGYVIDNRPHFEILGAKYKNNDPASEEEIWIPIRQK